MPRLPAAIIDLRDSEREILETLLNRHNTPQQRLYDAPRPGAPNTFNLEQITQLYAIACNPPEQYARPISHWSSRELADELIKQAIVESFKVENICQVYTTAQARCEQDAESESLKNPFGHGLLKYPSIRSVSPISGPIRTGTRAS
jgi:hypothetical protein